MLTNGFQYQIEFTVEFDVVKQWTGDGDFTFGGVTYSTGKILEIQDIPVSQDIGDSNLIVKMADITLSDRAYYNQDLGPQKCKVQLLWRKLTLATGVYSAWSIGAAYEGKLSDGTYREGIFEIRIQRVYDDVWRGEPLRWTGSEQRRRFPNDSGLDRADNLRRNGVAIGWQA